MLPRVFVPPPRQTPATAQFPFTFGRFSLSSWRVPYFLTTMSLREAAESLRLVNEFPGAENLEWKINELYQRDIDWTRVQRQIVPYLRSSDHPQFFNALTVALLPVRDNKIHHSFEGPGWAAPSLLQQEGFATTRTVGPVQIGYYGEWTTVDDEAAITGQLRWNPRQVFSVAIDGQHRLAAIKELNRGAEFDERLLTTRIPVILVVLSDDVGYERPPSEQNLVGVLRRLFIDLNKHAKSVNRSRQILLDDNDPHALCVRALVGQQLVSGASDLDANPPRLPLSLVDWHTGDGRFDAGPYLTTILGLDWIVGEALGTKPIADYTDLPKVRGQLKQLSDSLGLALNSEGSATLDRLHHCLTMARPFTYTGTVNDEGSATGELSEIVSAFQRVWAPALGQVLTRVAPYRKLVQARVRTGTLAPEFVSWYYLWDRKRRENATGGRATEEYNSLMGRLQNREESPASEQELRKHLQTVEAAKGKGNDANLAFSVVFQRALISAFIEFAKVGGALGDRDEEERGGETELDEDAAGAEERNRTDDRARVVTRRGEEFVRGLNMVLDAARDFLKVGCALDTGDGDDTRKLWSGSILSPAGTIDFTQGASKRAQEVIFWAAALGHCVAEKDVLVEAGFEEFWYGVDESTDPLHKRLRRSFKRYVGESGSAGRVLAARDEDYDEDDAWVECEARFRWVWDRLGLAD